MKRIAFLFILLFSLSYLLACSSTIGKVEDKYENIDQLAHKIKDEVQVRADAYFGESMEANKKEDGIQDIIYQKRGQFTDKQWKEMVRINEELVKGYKDLRKAWKEYQKQSKGVEKYIDKAKEINTKVERVGQIVGKSLQIGIGLVG